jgi:hypothetical protein
MVAVAASGEGSAALREESVVLLGFGGHYG